LKTKIISLLIFLLIIPSSCYSIDTILSPDGRWIVAKPFTDYNSITIGIIPTDIKIHKFEIFCFLNEKLINKEDYEPSFPASYMLRVKYKTLDSIWPNFCKLRYIIYIDNKPVVTYEFHTNGSGTINYSFITWLN